MSRPSAMTRAEPYTGSPQRIRPQRSRSSSGSEKEHSAKAHTEGLGGSRTQGGIFPIAKPALLPWRSAGQFCRSRPGSTPRDMLGNLDSDDEDTMMSVAGPADLSVNFDGACDDNGAPATPQTSGRMAQLISYGLMTPPETPRDERPKEDVFITSTQNMEMPLTPPVTPGYTATLLRTDYEGDDTSKRTISPRQKKNHVRFVSPARSTGSGTATGLNDSTEGSTLDEQSDDDHFSDAASTISTLDDYGISQPGSPILEPKLEPEPVFAEEPELDISPAAKPLQGFDLWTQAYKDNVPKPARAGCAQCLRLNLPCDKAMPSCGRCVRRINQHDANALSSSSPGARMPAAHACCVPMLQTSRHAAAARAVPIFKAYAECVGYMPDGEAAEAAKTDLEARRRAAYDAIVAEDGVRADRANWTAPRVRAPALLFQGREVTERWDGTIVLRRAAGIDGNDGPGRKFVVPMRWQRNLEPMSPSPVSPSPIGPGVMSLSPASPVGDEA